jgi:hypothetical protein
MNNDKDKIRDMVLALSRGDHEAANKASAEVIANKTAELVQGSDEKLEERHSRPDRRHHNLPRTLRRQKRNVMRKPGSAVAEGYRYSDDDADDYADDFADRGGRSALRASSRGNPRIHPCPTCGEENKDVALGYQCDHCADRAEGRGGEY